MEWYAYVHFNKIKNNEYIEMILIIHFYKSPPLHFKLIYQKFNKFSQVTVYILSDKRAKKDMRLIRQS